MMVNTMLKVNIEIDDDEDCYASFEDENDNECNEYYDITELDKDQQEKIREAFKKILDF